MNHRLAFRVVVVATAFQTLTTCAEADTENVLQGSVRAHDPSTIVRQNGRYYVYATGVGLRSKWSSDLVHWNEGPAVFDRDQTPAWTGGVAPGFRGHFWAPDIAKQGGEYRLYYSVSRFGKQTSAIGLAVSPTLDPDDPLYGWRDVGIVIQSHDGDAYNAIDPSVLQDDDGRQWMAFGSYWRGIHLVELDPATGLRRHLEQPPRRLASADSIEAATLLRHGDNYFLFVNHGQCCRGVESTYRVLVGRSDCVTGPYLDRDGLAMSEGGGSVVLESVDSRIGPGHIAPVAGDESNRFAFHYYDGNDQGKSKLALASWTWTEDGWPVAADVRLSGPGTRPQRDVRSRD
ncbi:Intracellular endo-alpha-(1-_5)-L-arabinanase [Botrimarina colliarenosi]|uniref:Intracellular endo-alpha-(1->5)-L-arabinanase n=1 Tax=Botrimarina colliarenosi TaxID=2528001 RepID=A0A5C6A122_9BACT|nr:arabinan endo-1,5-alpha-L-arabinosidase [Botrimarina colliarenosi]TWT92898.1 Intracellular endo-alpha-(1->5)-L-arabinanase [Botrimarina colliarenosi]